MKGTWKIEQRSGLFQNYNLDTLHCANTACGSQGNTNVIFFTSFKSQNLAERAERFDDNKVAQVPLSRTIL